jgi:hypothetical protein
VNSNVATLIHQRPVGIARLHGRADLKIPRVIRRQRREQHLHCVTPRPVATARQVRFGVAAFGRKPPSKFQNSLRRSAETPLRREPAHASQQYCQLCCRVKLFGRGASIRIDFNSMQAGLPFIPLSSDVRRAFRQAYFLLFSARVPINK